MSKPGCWPEGTGEHVSSKPQSKGGRTGQEVRVAEISEWDHGDDLNGVLRSHHPSSSSSSNDASSANPCGMPAFAPNSPPRAQPMPTPPSGASMTLPKVWTPLIPRDSIQLVKKHHSQPQPGLERLHHVSVNIDVDCPAAQLQPHRLPASHQPPLVEETDIDEVPDSMDMLVDGSDGAGKPHRVSFIGFPEELEFLDPDIRKPPTPPLHRFPSWVRQLYSDCTAD